jgi:hypothetical protein
VCLCMAVCGTQIVPQLRAGVNQWRELVPLVSALRSPHLRERHWAKVRRRRGGWGHSCRAVHLQARCAVVVLWSCCMLWSCCAVVVM